METDIGGLKIKTKKNPLETTGQSPLAENGTASRKVQPGPPGNDAGTDDPPNRVSAQTLAKKYDNEAPEELRK